MSAWTDCLIEKAMRELQEIMNGVIDGFNAEVWEIANRYEVVPGWDIEGIDEYYSFESLTPRQFKLCVFIAVCREYAGWEYKKTPQEYVLKSYMDEMYNSLFDHNLKTGKEVLKALDSGRQKANQRKKGEFKNTDSRNKEILRRYTKLRLEHCDWKHGKTIDELTKDFGLSDKQLRTIIGPDPFKKIFRKSLQSS